MTNDGSADRLVYLHNQKLLQKCDGTILAHAIADAESGCVAGDVSPPTKDRS
jgi:2C-methyl-D-erythritol 2,4-cyclodiphosphate synthase